MHSAAAADRFRPLQSILASVLAHLACSTHALWLGGPTGAEQGWTSRAGSVKLRRSLLPALSAADAQAEEFAAAAQSPPAAFLHARLDRVADLPPPSRLPADESLGDSEFAERARMGAA